MADKRVEYLEVQKLKLARDTLKLGQDTLKLETQKHVRGLYEETLRHWRFVFSARAANILAFFSTTSALLSLYWFMLLAAGNSPLSVYRVVLLYTPIAGLFITQAFYMLESIIRRMQFRTERIGVQQEVALDLTEGLVQRVTPVLDTSTFVQMILRYSYVVLYLLWSGLLVVATGVFLRWIG